jgi:hypothetical protein
MEEPGVIADRLNATAKDTIAQAREIGKQAIADAADVDQFTATKVINSYMQAADLAITSGMQAAKDMFGVAPPPQGTALTSEEEAAEGRRLVADAMEAISRRMMREASLVAQDTATQLDKNPSDPGPNPNGPSVWVKSLAKLGDIFLLGGIELVETALIGPAPFEKDPAESNVYPAPDNGGRRLLRVKTGGLCRPGTVDPIPDAQIRFFRLVDNGPGKDPSKVEVPGGILVPTQASFYLSVVPVGLISGMYLGDVEVMTLKIDDDGVEKPDVVLKTVPVEVPL